jgi:carboxymethylenebutenolidase
MGTRIDFMRPDGKQAPGYLAEAASGSPSVVVIQEWWGLNPQILSVADRLKEAGYTALVPDLYRGYLATDADDASATMNRLDWNDATTQDIRGAVQFLKGRGSKVAILGFCMGGALTLAADVHVPEVDAVVCFYGIPPEQLADLKQCKAPVLGHFAIHDDWVTPAKVIGLEADLKVAGVEHSLHSYDAHHAFFNDTRPEVYKAHLADVAWERTLNFLEAQLT